MKECYVFDIDGTLTESRQKISEQFLTFMLNFCKDNDVYLVTGSDRPKTFEQIGFELYEAVKGVWQTNGNEYWEGNRRVSGNDYTPTYEFKKYLNDKVNLSRYPIKTGGHIEGRTGMINFSTIGRNCTPEQRKEYYKWDCKNYERALLCEGINKEFPELLASVGGEISIDIAPRKNNKSQVAEVLNKKYSHIHFFGDRMEYGGNDYPLATTITLGEMGTTYPIKSWEETWERLKEL
jgi:phosphomannomutase